MSHSLVPLAPGVYVWLADAPSHSHTNIGVVIAQDGLTVIDSGLCPAISTPLADELALLSSLPVRRLTFSSSHIDQVGGGAAFPLAAVYGTAQTSDHLDQPPNPKVWQRMHPEFSPSFSELVTRPVTHVIGEPAHLCPASIAVPLSGQQFENLAVQVPGANVVFMGALGSFGVVPLGFEADFDAWLTSLEQLASFGEIFVPAHGPIGGIEEIDALRTYLDACRTAKGSMSALAEGPWLQWTHPEFHEVNVERAHMLSQGDASPPPSMLRLLGR